MTLAYNYLSTISTCCWIVALLPQQWNNYTTKSVHGLSPYLLVFWLLGDTFNLVGCVLTNQLPFQTYLSCYFVFSDLILDIQFYYYHTKNNCDTIQSEMDGSIVVELEDENNINDGGYTSSLTSMKPKFLSKSQIITATTSLLSISPASALPLPNISTYSKANSINGETLGLIFAWSCTIMYCCSRVPQLYHNYVRKSVDGISPLLFTFALLANLTYAMSILVSDVPNNMSYKEFIWNEFPYLLGSLGTVIFDGIYFGQREIYKII